MGRPPLGVHGVPGRAGAGRSGAPDALCSLPHRCRPCPMERQDLWAPGATQSFTLESSPWDKAALSLSSTCIGFLTPYVCT